MYYGNFTSVDRLPNVSQSPEGATAEVNGARYTRTTGGWQIDPVSVAYSRPGRGQRFTAAIEGMQQVEDTVFGSAAVAGSTPVSKAIKDVASLATDFRPLQGEYSVGGSHLGGAGPTTINSEPQRYVATFGATAGSPACHIMDADGIRLQAVLSAGSFNVYLRTQVLTSGGGINVTAPGSAAVTTAIVDAGLVAGDLPGISVGDVVTNAERGLMVVTAKDASTVSLEAVSGAVRSAYKLNWHLTWTKFAFGQVTADVVNGTTTSVTFTRPLPTQVVPGCFAMGVARTATATNDPKAKDRAKVLTVSGDRLTVTFDAPLNLDASVTTANFGGLLFIPQLWSGQLWSRRSYGPHQAGKRAQALRVEVTMPSQPSWIGGGNFTKAQVDAALAAAPGTLWGYWPALWLYSWRPGPNGDGQVLIAGARNPWSEVDIMELFCRVWHGQNMWTGNLLDQAFTRTRLLASSAANASRISGASWQTSAATLRDLSADSAYLAMPGPLSSGTKRSFGIVWDRDQVTHYIDDIPVCTSQWSVDTDYPHQLGLNVACGSLTGTNCPSLFFPQTDAQATGQWMKVHSIQTWEA